VIKVGGSTEVEVKERKDRVDDALHATRAAVEEGIVPGGGTALLYATKAIEGLKGANDDQTRGIDIIRKALYAPVRQIAQNAGHDGAVISGKLLEGNDPTLGFNAQTDTYENLVTAGVIDPTKVVRTALQDAASVAGLLITTEAAISELPDDKAPAGMPAAAWAAWAGWTSSDPTDAEKKGRGSNPPALFAPGGLQSFRRWRERKAHIIALSASQMWVPPTVTRATMSAPWRQWVKRSS
jgi:chaperonin GroEL